MIFLLDEALPSGPTKPRPGGVAEPRPAPLYPRGPAEEQEAARRRGAKTGPADWPPRAAAIPPCLAGVTVPPRPVAGGPQKAAEGRGGSPVPPGAGSPGTGAALTCAGPGPGPEAEQRNGAGRAGGAAGAETGPGGPGWPRRRLTGLRGRAARERPLPARRHPRGGGGVAEGRGPSGGAGRAAGGEVGENCLFFPLKIASAVTVAPARGAGRERRTPHRARRPPTHGKLRHGSTGIWPRPVPPPPRRGWADPLVGGGPPTPPVVVVPVPPPRVTDRTDGWTERFVFNGGMQGKAPGGGGVCVSPGQQPLSARVGAEPCPPR